MDVSVGGALGSSGDSSNTGSVSSGNSDWRRSKVRRDLVLFSRQRSLMAHVFVC